jgi:hypothetical protein
MDDALAKYFDRLDARAIDPNETVEIDGRLRRILDVHKAVQKKRRNAKYRDKDRAADRDRSAAWKSANPDKTVAQRRRRWDRNYHRPFIGIDAEGQNFPGDDKFDKLGNVYPLHRTILWGAGGWQRLHSSTELVNGVGLPTLGKECQSHFLGDERKLALDPISIIEWLLTLPEKYGPENGYPMA